MKVPSGWTKKKVQDLIDRFDAGVSVNGGDRPAESNEIGVLKISAITDGKFRPKENKVIHPHEIKRANLNPKQNRIIMSRANTPDLVAANAYIDRDYPSVFLSDKLWQFEPREEVTFSMRWLSQVLGSTPFRKKLSEMATGTSQSMKNISKRSVMYLDLLVPTYDEQESLAKTLTTWDTAIEKAEKLIETKQQLKQVLMTQLLTGSKRIEGFLSTWQPYHLGELFRERCETGYQDFPLISITGESGIIFRDSGNRKDSSSEDKSSYLRICPGDIGYNTMRMWQGVSALSSLEGIVSPAYTVCTPKNGVDGQYMAYLFKLPRVINLFYRHSQGLTSDTWNLKFNNFAKIKVTIPDIEEQKEIVKVFTVCDKEIQMLKKNLEAIKKQKRGLMHKLLTGEWRVKAAGEVS